MRTIVHVLSLYMQTQQLQETVAALAYISGRPFMHGDMTTITHNVDDVNVVAWHATFRLRRLQLVSYGGRRLHRM